MHIQNNFTPYITDRELQVMLLAFTGKVSKEIARELNITKYAVDLYRRNVLARFSVNCCTELLFKYPGIPDLQPGQKRHYPQRRQQRV